MLKSVCQLVLLSLITICQSVSASTPINATDIENVERKEITDESDKQRLSVAAGYLADYEIAAGKLLGSLEQTNIDASAIRQQAEELLALSETVIESARFRLPQCDTYLEKTLVLKDQLQQISLDSLEKDYHHDGALPKAPGECYHTKDLFVHPATVIVLTRDDPNLKTETRGSISAEITEVLAHTELVRQLVIY